MSLIKQYKISLKPNDVLLKYFLKIGKCENIDFLVRRLD